LTFVREKQKRWWWRFGVYSKKKKGQDLEQLPAAYQICVRT
jgi:hypothetical protein